MQDLISKGAAWFRSVAREHMSIHVEYRAVGSLVAVRQVPAMMTTGRHETLEPTGQIVRVESRDFFVNVADYPTVPKKGDLVTAEGREYEVFAPGGTNCWVWADRQQEIRRIHTQVVP